MWCHESTFSVCSAHLHQIRIILSSITCFSFLYFSHSFTFYFFFPVQIKIMCHMASFQKACRDNWLWCLHVYSSTGRTTHTPRAFCPGWRWNKEHIAGGRPPEQRERKKENAKEHDASFSDLLGRAVCVCLCVCCSFCNSSSFGKNAQLQLLCSSPGHTQARQRHLLCGCREIFFPATVEYCLRDRVHMKPQSEYDQIRVSSAYISLFKLPLACEVTFEAQNVTFGGIVWNYPATEEEFLCIVSIWAHHSISKGW